MLESCYCFFKIVPVEFVNIDSERVIANVPKYLFGFELLTYSYAPTGFPTLVWAKVVESDIWAHVNRSDQ